jgi:hypothetical protein
MVLHTGSEEAGGWYVSTGKEIKMPNNSDADQWANQLRVQLAIQEIENDQARFLEVKDGKDTYRVRAGRDVSPWEFFDLATGNKTVIGTSTLTYKLQESLDRGARVTAKEAQILAPAGNAIRTSETYNHPPSPPIPIHSEQQEQNMDNIYSACYPNPAGLPIPL